MKIAVFHELHNGGARRVVNEFSKRLIKNNQIDLYIVDEKKDKTENIYFKHVFFFKYKVNKSNIVSRLYNDTIGLISLAMLHKKIASKIDKENYDFVFIHPSKYTQAPFILSFLKSPKIYYSEEVLRMIYDPLYNKLNNINSIKQIYEKRNRVLRKLIDQQNIKKANLIITNSKFTKSNIHKAYGLDSKVALLGVDTKFFKPAVSKKDVDLLFIGDKDELSGFELVKNALDLIKHEIKIEYLITGDKWILDKDLAKLYSRAKITLCLYRNEPFGLIPLEAMASGSVVIALDEGGYSETIINNKTGYLISNDSKKLADLIEKLLKNDKKLQEISKNARSEMLANWDWDKKTKELLLLLNNFNK